MVMVTVMAKGVDEAIIRCGRCFWKRVAERMKS